MTFSGIFYFVDSGSSVFKYFIRSGLQVLVVPLGSLFLSL